MTEIGQVTEAVYRAVETMNRGLPPGKQLPKSADTVLFGPQGTLDSIGLVDLVLLAEQQIAKDFAHSITLADQRAMSRQNSPFRTIRTLSDYILELLNERPNH